MREQIQLRTTLVVFLLLPPTPQANMATKSKPNRRRPVPSCKRSSCREMTNLQPQHPTYTNLMLSPHMMVSAKENMSFISINLC
jgi:hypothetical protein